MTNLLNKITLGFVVLAFSSQSFSISRQYRGGDVFILIKNNEPCFYIENMKLSGTYYITLFEDRTIKTIGEFTSKFQEKYPKKTSCISSSNFSNAVYEKNKPYLVVITTEKGLSFGTSFCVSNRNGNKAIQDFTMGKCEDKKESLWERFLRFIDIN